MTPTTSDLPPGWNEATLGDLCDVIADGTHYTPTYVENGIPFYSVENVTRDDFINVKYISTAEHQRLIKRCRPLRGDILMTRIGSLGETKFLSWDVDASIYVSLALLRPGRKVDGHYLYAFTKSRRFVKAVEDRSLLWASPKKINMGDIAHVPVLVPVDPGEQRAIAEVLLTLEEHVAALERMIAKKQAIKQGMMQHLLAGKTRLPGFDQPWVERQVSDIASITKGTQLGRAEMDSAEHVPVWNGGVEPSGYTSTPNVRRAVVTVSEGGNSCGWVGRPEGSFWLGGHCYALDPRNEGHTVRFLYHRLKSVEPQIMELRVSSGLPNIQKKRLAEFGVSVPTDPKEAAALTAVLDDADAEVRLLDRRITKALSVKTGMMQELLTGRTRLRVEEGAA